MCGWIMYITMKLLWYFAVSEIMSYPSYTEEVPWGTSCVDSLQQAWFKAQRHGRGAFCLGPRVWPQCCCFLLYVVFWFVYSVFLYSWTKTNGCISRKVSPMQSASMLWTFLAEVQANDLCTESWRVFWRRLSSGSWHVSALAHGLQCKTTSWPFASSINGSLVEDHVWF